MRRDASIVLPTHNGARYVGGAIASCLQQTFPHLELIVVDDASTDETPQIVASYAEQDPRVRVLRLSRNRGLPGALNAGLDVAAGRYLTWTSDDNLYRPGALEAMVDVLERNQEVEVVYSEYTVVDGNLREIERGNVAERSRLLYWNAIGPCFLFRREVYERTGHYAEDLFLAEDYDFWLRAAAAHEFQRLRRDLYVYRRHEGSLTGTRGTAVWDAVERALARNASGLRWASSGQRAGAYWRLARATRERRRVPRYLARALLEGLKPPFRERC